MWVKKRSEAESVLCCLSPHCRGKKKNSQIREEKITGCVLQGEVCKGKKDVSVRYEKESLGSRERKKEKEERSHVGQRSLMVAIILDNHNSLTVLPLTPFSSSRLGRVGFEVLTEPIKGTAEQLQSGCLPIMGHYLNRSNIASAFPVKLLVFAGS